MKKNILILLALLIQASIGAYAQYVNNELNGIHVLGGSSSQAQVSSNIGTGCNATGTNSFAGGNGSSATGSCGFAFGYQSTSNPLHGGNAVALGYKCQALETCSYAVGYNVIANGSQTFGFGYDIETCVENSIVIGTGNSDYNTLVAGGRGITIGMGSTMPTLFITEGTLTSTGKVAIGNTYNPQAKLHIVADEYEDAGIFLQPNGKNGEISYINMTDSNHQIVVKNDGSMHVKSSNDDLNLLGTNVNLSGNVLSIGKSGDRKFYATTQGNPVIYSNAYRTNDGCYRYTEGSSYAIEFNSNGLLLRTAVNQMPRGVEITNWKDALSVKTNGAITLNGKVGVNTENTAEGYALAVDGGILTTKVYIQDVEDWPDHVFGGEYNLMSLNDLRQYIGDNRHLPDVPSQEEVTSQGYDLNAMQQTLLKKIEELTLYTLQQQEEIEMLKKTVEELKGK